VFIKFAVLALVAKQPRHGYAIRASFERELGDLWDLHYGQVYQVLATLEQEGLITGREERVGRRPMRRTYSISPKGRDALRKWLLQPPRLRPLESDLYLRIRFAAELDPDLLARLVDQHGHACRERLATLTDQAQGEARSIGAVTIARDLLATAAVMHAKADVEALERCQAALDAAGSRLGGTAGTGVPAGALAVRPHARKPRA
jgi:DNA-binding PadR family transcriptional regulator